MGPFKFWRLSGLSLLKNMHVPSLCYLISIFLGCFALSPSDWQHLANLLPNRGVLGLGRFSMLRHERARPTYAHLDLSCRCPTWFPGKRPKLAGEKQRLSETVGGSAIDHLDTTLKGHTSKILLCSCQKKSFNKSLVHQRRTTALINHNLYSNFTFMNWN